MLLERITIGTKPSKVLATTKKGIRSLLKENASVPKLADKENKGLSIFEKHTCSLCKRVLANRKALLQHLNGVHGQAPAMFCDLCPISFNRKSRLIQHMFVHGTKIFACNICDYKSARIHALKAHKKVHALKEICKMCNKLVTSLKEHMRVHRPRKACPVCEKMVATHHFSNHIRRHDRWNCKDCGESFVEKKDLKK